MKLKYEKPTIDVVAIQIEEDIVKSSVLPGNQKGVVEQEWDEQQTEYRTIDLGDI